jgi:hypothetical protein
MNNTALNIICNNLTTNDFYSKFSPCCFWRFGMKKFVFPLVVATVKSSAKLVEVRGIVFFFYRENPAWTRQKWTLYMSAHCKNQLGTLAAEPMACWWPGSFLEMLPAVTFVRIGKELRLSTKNRVAALFFFLRHTLRLHCCTTSAYIDQLTDIISARFHLHDFQECHVI